MNKTKIPPPTDEEILSYERVPVLKAAKYLGMTRPMLAYKLEQGEMPFGTALKSGTKWTYSIDPQRLYDFKHNINKDDVITRILVQQKQIIEMLTEIITSKPNAKEGDGCFK